MKLKHQYKGMKIQNLCESIKDFVEKNWLKENVKIINQVMENLFQ